MKSESSRPAGKLRMKSRAVSPRRASQSELRRLLGLRAFEQPMHAAQLDQRLVGLTHLLFEQRDLPLALLRGQLQGMLRSPARLRLHHLADSGEREAELLALQDEREPIAARTAENALAALAHRREQTAALVETQGAQRNVEFLGQVSDAEFALGHVLRLIVGVDPEDVST